MLQEVEWDYIVVDEGHRLKNKNCELSIQLKVGKFQKQFVMPLILSKNEQNNLSKSVLNYKDNKLIICILLGSESE